VSENSFSAVKKTLFKDHIATYANSMNSYIIASWIDKRIIISTNCSRKAEKYQIPLF